MRRQYTKIHLKISRAAVGERVERLGNVEVLKKEGETKKLEKFHIYTVT